MSFVKYGTIIGFSQVTELPSTIGGYGITDAVPSGRTITINGTTFDLAANRTWTVGSVTSVALSVPTGLSISGSPITASGTLAITLTSGYSIPTTASQTNWDTAYTNRITSLTTTGTSGAATLIGNVLNIPQYAGGGGGGTVTSVAALTLGTTGTDLTSTVANSTTTPVITLNVPTASATNRGALSSADWTTFNNKQGTISLSAIGSTPNANAATLTGSVLNLQPASDSFGGVVTTGTQTFAGNKTFNGILTANGSDYHILSAVSTSAQLRLERTGTSTGLMYLGADNIGFKILDSAFALRLTLTSAGNLGLGVTPSASWFTGSKVIQIGNTAALWNNGANNSAFSHNAIFGDTTTNYIQSSGASYYRQIGGEHNWFNAPSGTAGNAISFTQAMTLFATGNLVIGSNTDDTINKLQVNGSGKFSGFAINATPISNGTSQTFARLLNTGGDFYIGVEGSTAGGFFNGSSAYASVMYSTTAQEFIIGGTRRLQIASTGAATFSSSIESFNPTSNIIDLTTTTGYNYKGFQSYWGTRTGTAFDFNIDVYNSGGSQINALKITQTGAATFSQSLGIGGVADSVKGLTYSPTLTDITNINISSTSGATFTYIRVGYIVTVNGFVNVAPNTVGTLFQLNISLPIASAFISTSDATGVATSLGFGYGYLIGDATADTVQLNATSTTLSSKPFHVQFSYFLR